MNKTDLINAVAEQADLTKKEAGSAVDAVFESIQNSLAKGETYVQNKRWLSTYITNIKFSGWVYGLEYNCAINALY